MSRSRTVCLLVMPKYKPGDPRPEGYLQWHEWAEAQHKAGLRQRQCGRCGLWNYPQELSSEVVRTTAYTKGGRPFIHLAPLCKVCDGGSDG